MSLAGKTVNSDYKKELESVLELNKKLFVTKMEEEEEEDEKKNIFVRTNSRSFIFRHK